MQTNLSNIIEEYNIIKLKEINDCDNRKHELFSKYDGLKELYYNYVSANVGIAKIKLSKDFKNEEKYKKDIILFKKFLTEHNIDINDFSIHYQCMDCKDTGYIDGKKCHCLLKKEIEFFKKNSSTYMVPENETFENIDYELYNQSNVHTFDGTPYKAYMQNIVSVIKRRLNDITKNPIFLNIVGTSGTGKTYLYHSIINFLKTSNLLVSYFSMSEIVNSFFDDNYIYISDICKMSDVLLIDNFGLEISSKFSNSKFFAILDKRLVEKKSTIIVTKCSNEDILEIYGDDIASRINNKFEKIILYGIDFRGIM